ncbi:hypothetical protein PGT21_018370 [Puccinia graminis f. sp. tritici]|uniref:Uncharacterized protein n=1 Tax=Puccinia graminis f. sp. tritici TaxID=56615 RepID=A0A5B0LNP3_PUCGR|nr:hypothetical protein PGTUg99_003364 [Puccinia graminis f. sp. tritici]KAA1119224.1 hypothetical protein PGT21_018370 [Puccinia graminis f. sp. tritici]
MVSLPSSHSRQTGRIAHYNGIVGSLGLSVVTRRHRQSSAILSLALTAGILWERIPIASTDTATGIFVGMTASIRSPPIGSWK